MSKDEELFAFPWQSDWEPPDEEPDPYFRPDETPDEEECEPEMISWQPVLPTEPCPCCCAEKPEDPPAGYLCSVCGWAIDYDTEDNPDAPSDQNDGLSLTEARWNFQTFGISNPRIIES